MFLNQLFNIFFFAVSLLFSKPRATLSSIIPAGGSVTLSCSVEGSAGWKFDWFRYRSVLYLDQFMRGNEANSFIRVSQGGLYHCRGGRGDPAFFSEDSNEVTVQETPASLTVSPDRVQHFTSDSVSLTCEGNFTEWRVKKFTDDGRLYYSNCRRMTGSTCKISYILKSDAAVYWCESGSGEFSSAVNITVQEELKISAVSKSDEGFYKCEYSGRESPQSWMLVKADSSSSPVWVIFGLVCGVSLILLLLFLYRCRKIKGETTNYLIIEIHRLIVML
uniref:Ig-like domain-containing protein n=1 Tax=Amphilophus citrinellus TaxID=61819 RepID=A0A3Q0SGU6_AMPCI